MPITLNEIRVVDGQLSFRNFSSDPQVHVYASDIRATLYNLTNTDDADGTRTATFEGTGKLFDQAPIEASARFDPFTDWEDFEVDLRVTDVPLKQLNDFSRAYGNFDFAGGTGDRWSKSRPATASSTAISNRCCATSTSSTTSRTWPTRTRVSSAACGRRSSAAAEVLKNQRKDQFATRVELSGTTKKRTSARSGVRRDPAQCLRRGLHRPLRTRAGRGGMIRGRHQKHAHGHSVTE